MGPTPTPMQLQVLLAVHEHREQWGISPSTREMCRRLRLASTKAVAWHVDTLVRRGLLTRLPRTARSLMPTESGLHQLELAGLVPSREEATPARRVANG